MHLFFVNHSQAEPYTMLKLESDSKTGNDRYEGYAIDLIIELSAILGFEYNIVLQADREWTGAIGKVNSRVCNT